jgi:transcriptional regulator with XRE-family HTH domain
MSPLRKLRLSKNLTQKQVADATGIERSGLSKIEAGKRRPEIENLEKIVSFFGGKITVEEILWPERFIK